MIKLLLRGLLILVVVIVATLVFALEPIAKWAIESEGSKAVGARVDVDDVEITLYPTHLALYGLTVANPQEPMRNLIESEKVSADVDSKALLKRQFIADQVLLSGLQMATQRSTPGTLDGSMPAPKPDNEGSALPSIELPDPAAIMAEEKAVIQAEVKEIESGFKALEDKWQTKSKNLPQQARLDEFKARWEALKKKNTLERIAGAKQLRDDIKSELKQFKELSSEISSDTETAKALSLRAAQLPASQSQRIMSKYGVDQGSEGMLRLLLGDDATQFVQRGLTLYRQTVGELAAKEDSQPSEPAAELPVSILIREILIDGYQMLGEQKLAYNGRVEDVTDKLDKPISMKLQGGVEQQAQLLIDGLFKQQNDAMSANLSMTLKQLLLSGISLSQSPQLPLQLDKGLADVAANFSLDDDKLSGSVKGLVNQAKILVASAGEQNPTAQRLARALEGVSKLVMDMRVNGSVDDPIVKLKSNLDSILGDVLGEELKGRVKELESSLKADINSKYGSELNQLQEKRELLASYKELLGDREAAMEALMAELGRKMF